MSRTTSSEKACCNGYREVGAYSECLSTLSSWELPMIALPTESAVSSDTYIGGKNVEEIAQEIEMGGECGWHLANVCNCGTWKNPQYE